MAFPLPTLGIFVSKPVTFDLMLLNTNKDLDWGLQYRTHKHFQTL